MGDTTGMPSRIQRKRTKGWRMPPNTVSVTRPGPFGNPFTPQSCRNAGYVGTDQQIRKACVEAFRTWIGKHWRAYWDGAESEAKRQRLLNALPQLRGKDLACFCALDCECHADVLLELANA